MNQPDSNGLVSILISRQPDSNGLVSILIRGYVQTKQATPISTMQKFFADASWKPVPGGLAGDAEFRANCESRTRDCSSRARSPIYSSLRSNGKYSNLRLIASNGTYRRTGTRPQFLRWYVCMLTLQDKITFRRSAWSASFRPPPSPPAHRTAAQACSPRRVALPGRSSAG